MNVVVGMKRFLIATALTVASLAAVSAQEAHTIGGATIPAIGAGNIVVGGPLSGQIQDGVTLGSVKLPSIITFGSGATNINGADSTALPQFNLPIGVGISANNTYAAQFQDFSGLGGISVQVNSSRSNSTAYSLAALFLAQNTNTSNFHPAEAIYGQLNVSSGANVGKVSVVSELSVNNSNTVTQSVPGNINVGQEAAGLRVDSGIGSAGPTNADNLINLINNGAAAETAILVGDTALDTGTLTHPPALSLPAGNHGYALVWYQTTAQGGTTAAYNAPAWSIYSTNIANNGNKLLLNDASLQWGDASNTYFSASTATLRQARTGGASSIVGQRLDTVGSGTILQLSGQGQNSTGGQVNYGSFLVNVSSDTATAETGNVQLQTINAGSTINVLTYGPGVQIGAPTGGDKGIGTINIAGGIFTNGTAGVSKTCTVLPTVANGIITSC